jgi:hypothetical protein
MINTDSTGYSGCISVPTMPVSSKQALDALTIVPRRAALQAPVLTIFSRRR